VASIDDPLWEKSYENVYHQYSLQKEWYVVLGNHDYKTNPQAEVDYSKKSARWKMPSRYYSVKLAIDGDTLQKALFVFMDTNPFIEKYYKDKDHSEMVKQQDSSAQKKWLLQVLSDPDPTIKWKFVVGHHPLYTSGKRLKSQETLHHFISGAGSEIREVKGELAESRFKASDHGFLLFSVTNNRMKVQAINWEGRILYEQFISREH
jgi:hypothetical protein